MGAELWPDDLVELLLEACGEKGRGFTLEWLEDARFRARTRRPLCLLGHGAELLGRAICASLTGRVDWLEAPWAWVGRFGTGVPANATMPQLVVAYLGLDDYSDRAVDELAARAPLLWANDGVTPALDRLQVIEVRLDSGRYEDLSLWNELGWPNAAAR